jgi:hypothetical protein
MSGGTGEPARRKRTARRRLRRAATWLARALACTSALGPAASAAASRADRAATHAYLAADLAYTQAMLAGLPAWVAGSEGVASRLSGACPGVLAGAPVGGSPVTSLREAGERARASAQESELIGELGSALNAPIEATRRRAGAAFVSAVHALHWSRPAITRGARAYAGLLAGEEEGPPLDVCADMRAWAASAYRTLSPATAAFVARMNAHGAALLSTGAVVPPQSPQLARYEGPQEHALMRRLLSLSHSHVGLLSRLQASGEATQAALGIRPLGTGAQHAIVIGRGRTAAGESFVAEVAPAGTAGSGISHGCAFDVTITAGASSSGNSSSGTCFSRGEAPRAPSVSCNEGKLAVEALLPAATHSVRLLLSDGRRITSPTLAIPPNAGGPLALYYQVVRGPSPIPVSLTELDAHGRALRIVRLHAVVECTRNPIKYLPGGLRTLVRGAIPHGPRFSIVAERYRFLGRVYFALKARTSEGSSSGGSIGPGAASPAARAFSREQASGCRPQPWDVLYGVLHDPRDTVLVRVAGRLVTLGKVAIPASLHAGGVLAYTALSGSPTEVIVRGPGGARVGSESLSEGARFNAEHCEAEREGGSGLHEFVSSGPAPARAASQRSL